MTIYTKTGDKGETSIYIKKAGKNIRLSKEDPLIEAIGSVDEVNSYIGIINSKLKTQNSKLKLKNKNLEEIFQDIQRNLFLIGSILAGAKVELKNLRTEEIEKEIDEMEKELPILKKFILSGGCEVSAHIMYARALVRKAERRIVKLYQKTINSKQKAIITYMNRLSDYLFVLARWVNWKNKVKEDKWKD